MKNTKRSLLTSCVSLLLCFVMLLGTTFAWFTDVATSSGNVIKTGNLDIVLKKGALNENGEWTWTENQGEAIFDYDKWEPGYMTYAALAVENVGSLDARITAKIVLNGTPTILGEVIDVYTYVGGFDNYDPSVRPDFSDGNWQTLGTMADLIGGTGTVLPARNLSAGQRARMIVALHMREDAGNEYQDMDLGANFDIKILATQASSESDSFGNDYDADAEWPNIPIVGNSASANVTLDENNQLTEEVTMTSADGKISATLPVGTKLLPGTTNVKLVISDKENSEANLTLEENEASLSLDVHITNIADDNTTPIKVELGEVLPVGLNLGNHSLYHVENGQTVGMTLLDDTGGTSHNTYAYDPATGEVIVYLASFSELALVADTTKAWEGNIAESFAGGTGTEADPFIIANADQMAFFSQKVSEDTTGEGHAKAYYKLISDINFAGDVAQETDDKDLMFYPVGYWKSLGTNNQGEPYYGYSQAFMGTFDGNGNTISNIYQNTWLMDGDYDAGYYKAAMGIFGAVFNGTVKNLTVDNFQSDGEFTPTGCIAAYAGGNSTFENISLANCNPRVYNTGNGGIVGLNYNSTSGTADKLVFRNITVDQTNKITALWGSYDVSCGGILGRLRENTKHDGTNTDGQKNTVTFENCHVAAIIDVNNDVCANYQYYQYRYSGMFIGTVDYIGDVPAVGLTDVVFAEDSTYTLGNWNEYWYCELVKNSLASYTHDHQFGRLTKISSLSDIQDENGDWNKEGNFVIPNADNTAAECYHIFKNSEGNLYQHLHDVADESNPNIYEDFDLNGDGELNDLKEDRQCYFLPFNQLLTGYGWGSSPKFEYNGITEKKDGTVKSVVKFNATSNTQISENSTVNISELFTSSNNADISSPTVQVYVSPVGYGSTVSASYSGNSADWQNGTLTFSGTGSAKVVITDHFYCTKTTLYVTVGGVVTSYNKFDSKFTGDFLYRVGNQNAVKLDSLFMAKDGVTIGDVDVTVEAVGNTGAGGTYTPNATWTNGTIQFSGTGVVRVTITDNNYCTPTELYLEVVDATNVTGLSGTISGNVVLLNDCGLSSLTVSGRNAVYGNGFTATYTGNGQYLNNGLKLGVINISENGTLDNLRIVAPIYPSSYLYYDEVKKGPSTVDGDKTRYHYQLSAVAASGNATISNCYIYGGRTNIFVNTGDVKIKNTVLECGTVANMQIQSNASHAITLENVTTIQYQVNPTLDNPNTSNDETENVMLGAGVLVGPETTENPAIVLNGYLKQYNWVTADDKNTVSNDTAKAIIGAALDATAYNHTVNGNTASNLGIIYMNTFGVNVTNNTDLPYTMGNVSMTVSGINISGQVYSVQNATAEQIYSDYANADRAIVNGLYQPQFKYDADLGGQYVAEGGDEHCFREGDTIKILFPSGDTKEIDLAALINIVKYSGQDLGLVITAKDENGNAVTVTDGKITLSNAGEYTVTYTVTDTLFFDKDGNTIAASEEYSWDVTVSVSLKDTAVPDAYFAFDSTKQIMGYAKKSMFAGGNTQYLPFLAGLKIYDYNGQTSYLRFDGDNDFNKIASATITGYTSANHVLIEVKLTDGGVINIDTTARAASGGSTYTGKLQTSGNTLYYVNDGTTSATTTTWVISSYKFTGNNGVEIDSGTVTFSNCESGSVPTGSFNTTIKYTVTYDPNEGNCGQTTGYATSASASVTLPTPTRSGYIFAGWYTAASGGTRVGGAGESYKPSANVTLYAQWGKPCTVTYDANGGTCDTASEKYTGTALTLPTPTRDGYWFIGWYDAATGGNKVGDAGTTYNPSGEITLYAHWQEKVEYTVTYDANGGTCGTTSATYQGTALTLPTPTRTGYTFNGWYTAASGGTKIGNAGATYTPTANITLYAQWQINSYTIKVTTSNGSVSGVTNGQSIAYGTTVSVTVSFDKNNSKSFKVTNDTTGETILSKDTAGTYTFTMPASNVTISVSSSGCFAEGTLITLADGTQKPIEEITFEDQLLAWDFNTGKYVATVPSLIDRYERSQQNVINLKFSDGTVVRMVIDHGFFDVDANNFVFLNEENVASYVGHTFVKVSDDGTYENVDLVGYEITVENVAYYSIQTAFYNNCIAEGMFTLTAPPEMLGYNGWFDYFEIGEGMKYDEEKMQADIEKYGLYTYEEFAEYVTYEQFMAFNGPYLKVLVGRGVVTYEQIIELIGIYVNPEN